MLGVFLVTFITGTSSGVAARVMVGLSPLLDVVGRHQPLPVTTA
jgi:hypothetical protein